MGEIITWCIGLEFRLESLPGIIDFWDIPQCREAQAWDQLTVDKSKNKPKIHEYNLNNGEDSRQT